MRNPLTVLALAALLTLPTSHALACGGCFSPPSSDTKQTVFQNAERVLFVRDEANKKSIVWIEVVYGGQAQNFGWVLPLPKVPVVGVGTRHVFDALDDKLAFRIARVEDSWENCRDPREGCLVPTDLADGQASDAFSGSAADVGKRGPDVGLIPVPGVEVLASGSTGPYDYAVIQGKLADPIYEWLTKNGYATPEKAKPILQSHATKGDVFVAIKLQNGQGVEAIRPITLEMIDAEPCVPLRLTSIAAAQEMTVTVTVAGTGRSVVKNLFDVALNPLRMTLLAPGKERPCLPLSPSGSKCLEPDNYAQVMSAAIDEAGGHAFVTEASVPGASLAKISPLQDLKLSTLAAGTTLLDLANFLATSQLPLDSEVVSALQAQVGQTGLFMDVTAQEALAGLKACAKFWDQPGAPDSCASAKVTLSKTALQGTPFAGGTASKQIQTSIIDPLFHVADLLGKSSRATRMVLRISPEEMDRDPVFAFHSTLPVVAPTLAVHHNQVCTDGWLNGHLQTRLTVAGLGSWLVTEKSIIDPLFKTAPAALSVTVQEEDGSPVFIAPSDIGVLDATIAGAKPGQLSIPTGTSLKPGKAWTPMASAPAVTALGAWTQPPNCSPKPGWQNGKLPPGEVVPVVDGGGSGADAGGAADAHTPIDSSSSTETPITLGSGSACTAGRAPSAALLPLLALAAWILRRRRAA